LQGTVLIHNAEELQSYSKTEEDRLEGIVKGIADAGVQVVAAGSAFGEMALHFIEKYKMMAVRIPSKFELRRFCRYSIPFLSLHLPKSSADFACTLPYYFPCTFPSPPQQQQQKGQICAQPFDAPLPLHLLMAPSFILFGGVDPLPNFTPFSTLEATTEAAHSLLVVSW